MSETITLILIILLITTGAFKCADILADLDEKERKAEEEKKHHTITL